MTPRSLRSRLIFIILTPLLFISLAAGIWQFNNTTDRAESIFDRGLLSAALAISRDIATSDGDALSATTRKLVNDTSGGEVFYHVYAPDGVFVTGYSSPPVLPKSVPDDQAEPAYYDARYRGQDVRVLRFSDVTTVGDITGQFNITTWQNAQVRSTFVLDVLVRSFAVITFLVLSVALVVWFGVGFGLRPLLELEEAIAKRTPTQLEPIRRAVPKEAQSLVETLNALLDRISRRISSKDEFISNAAHQLRNPVAGVLALAEAVRNAPNFKAMKQRSEELVKASKDTVALTNQLLSFERAGGKDAIHQGEILDYRSLVRRAMESFENTENAKGMFVSLNLPKEGVHLVGDAVLLREAVLNLLTNASVHGGPNVSKLEVTLTIDHECAVLTVEDDGVGIPREKQLEAISRFGQTNGGPGTGLGIPIAKRVAENHGGSLEIAESSKGALVVFEIPVSKDAEADLL